MKKKTKDKKIKVNKIIFFVSFNILLILGFFLYKNISFSIWKVFFLIFLISIFVFLNASLLNWKFKDIGNRLSYLILFFLSGLYISIYSYLSIIQYNGFFTGHYDLAVFDQAMWNTIQGRILAMSGSFEGYYNFLGAHFSPLLIILATSYFIWQDPRMLLVLQSLFLGLGAIPIFLIAKDKLKHNLLSLSFSFAYLLHPFISRVNLFEFHEICLAPFFLLFTFYFLQRRIWYLYFIFLFLSLMIKEDVSLIITALGIYAFFKANKRIGIITFLIGMTWAYLSVKVLIPYIRKATGSGVSEATYGYFGRLNLGESPHEIIKNLIFKPQNTLKILFSPTNEKLVTIILLTIPVGFLSLLSPVILIALPEIILHFMAGWAAQYVLAYQYSAPIFPWAVVSGIYGCSLLKRVNPLSLATSILIISFLSNFYFSSKAFNTSIHNPSFYGNLYNLNNHKTFFSIPKVDILKKYYQIKKERAVFKTLKGIIPKDCSVSVQDNLMSYFSQRKSSIYWFPDYKDSEYVILNTYGEEWQVIWAEGYSNGVNELLKDDRFLLFFRDNISGGGIALFARKERKEEIISNAKELVNKNPKSTYTHFILGSVHALTNNLKETKNELEIALQIDPKNIFAKEYLEECKILLDKGNN